jgi:hypothetical protein
MSRVLLFVALVLALVGYSYMGARNLARRS